VGLATVVIVVAVALRGTISGPNGGGPVASPSTASPVRASVTDGDFRLDFQVEKDRRDRRAQRPSVAASSLSSW
jgi:hypothetical protein